MSIMTPLPELTPILKQLRLSGLLESLETRNREAIENKLTYPEFLALMIQDEAARRDQKSMPCDCVAPAFGVTRRSRALTSTSTLA